MTEPGTAGHPRLLIATSMPARPPARPLPRKPAWGPDHGGLTPPRRPSPMPASQPLWLPGAVPTQLSLCLLPLAGRRPPHLSLLLPPGPLNPQSAGPGRVPERPGLGALILSVKWAAVNSPLNTPLARGTFFFFRLYFNTNQIGKHIQMQVREFTGFFKRERCTRVSIHTRTAVEMPAVCGDQVTCVSACDVFLWRNGGRVSAPRCWSFSGE